MLVSKIFCRKVNKRCFGLEEVDFLSAQSPTSVFADVFIDFAKNI